MGSFVDIVNELFRSVYCINKFINSINDGKATISSDDLAALQSEMKAFVVDVLGLKPSSIQGETRLKPVMDLVLDLAQKRAPTKTGNFRQNPRRISLELISCRYFSERITQATRCVKTLLEESTIVGD